MIPHNEPTRANARHSRHYRDWEQSLDETGAEYIRSDMETVTYATGAKGSRDAEGLRYDLISGIALERLARVCHEGAERYGDRNWEQGLTVRQCVNRAIRHLSKYCDGDVSEDHLGHALWRIHAAIHSEKAWPELNKVS